MKKYEKLEQQILEIQAEVDRLKNEEKKNKIPVAFNILAVKHVIDNWELNKKITFASIDQMFAWIDTPQEHDYWRDIADGDRTLSESDILYLQKLVILHYEQELKK